jgi:hypothetical protein
MNTTLKNKLLFILISCLVVIGMVSCQKDIDFTIPDANYPIGPDTTWNASVSENSGAYELKQELALDYDVDTVSLSAGSVLNFATASMLNFSITAGSIVTGSGDIFFGDMIVKSTALHTIGESVLMLKQNISNSGNLLSPGGTFFVSFYNMNHEELFIAPNDNIKVNYHSDNAYPGMKLFTEHQMDLLYSSWQQPLDSIHNNIVTFGDNHTVSVNNTGWFNCSSDSFYNNQQSKVALRLPSNYTNANTIAFISFNDIKAAINFEVDLTTKIFKTGLLPAGRTAIITVISKQGGYYFSTQETINTTSIATSGGYQMVNLTPVITSFSDLKNSLRGL